MALMPKRVKHRKSQRGRIRGSATRGNTVVFGDYGLQSHYENDHDRLTGHTYDQWYTDQNEVTYYLNEDGFLVARYYSDYNHTGPM